MSTTCGILASIGSPGKQQCDKGSAGQLTFIALPNYTEEAAFTRPRMGRLSLEGKDGCGWEAREEKSGRIATDEMGRGEKGRRDGSESGR